MLLGDGLGFNLSVRADHSQIRWLGLLACHEAEDSAASEGVSPTSGAVRPHVPGQAAEAFSRGL